MPQSVPNKKCLRQPSNGQLFCSTGVLMQSKRITTKQLWIIFWIPWRLTNGYLSFFTLVQVDPSNPQTWDYASQIMQAMQKLDIAISYSKMAISLEPKVNVIFETNLANLYLQKRNGMWTLLSLFFKSDFCSCQNLQGTREISSVDL